jgi:hypothetical protein
MTTICICGGGSLGHVIAGYLSSKNNISVNVLTQKPELWKKELIISTPEGNSLSGKLNIVSNNPEDVVKNTDIVLLCLPGFAIKEELLKIKPYIDSSTFVGTVFSSTGFFFEALEILENNVPLWGFQRVPFIARTEKYGEKARLLGYKNGLNIAIEQTEKKEEFRKLVEDMFDVPVKLLNNYYEASLTNSNPLLHTSRLFTMFGGKNEGITYPQMILFYEEWTIEAAKLLIDMDREFFTLLEHLPVEKNYLPRILDYYESYDADSLAKKLRSLQGLKGITSPMKEVENGWVPDFQSRYFQEDFPFGLHYIWQLAHEYNVDCPNIDKVYEWGIQKIK